MHRCNGEVIILIFGQGLWFGNRMERSLINPYQCRAFGIGLCDDLTDPNGRKLGFECKNDFIPLEMNGTTCGLKTRYPTDEEIDECNQIILSHEEDWDPTQPQIFTVNRLKATDTNVNDKIYEYNNIPAGFNRKGFINAITKRGNKYSNVNASITDGRHHEVKPETLAQKWGISLDKAKQTLKTTIQLAIRSASLPLKRRYRTDLMSQKLKRLSCRFYTDTFFSKSVSVNGNKCAQLYTDGNEMVIIYPIKSKAMAGSTLTEFAQDVGIPNELTMDGASEQTGMNTDMMKEIRRLKIRWHKTEPYSPWQNRAENAIG